LPCEKSISVICMFKDKIKTLWAKVKPYCNKYIIVTVFFLAMILFVGRGNVFNRIRFNREIRALEDEIERFEAQRDASKKRLDNLRIGEEELEKTARESYLMKKDDEDVFLLEHR